MTAASVSLLQVRAPPGRGRLACAEAENALRLATPDGERLLAIRRLDLGRMAAGARSGQWQARAAERIGAMRARAVHATTPGAAAAEAVWFRTTGEAIALLLAELAAGRPAAAWFWTLAVPDWRGEPLGRWLPRLLAQSLGDQPLAVAVARAVMSVAGAARIGTILPALAQAALPPEAIAALTAKDGSAAMAERGRQVLQRPGFRFDSEAMAQARRESAPVAARYWVLRLALLAAAPELAGQPRALDDTITALLPALLAPEGEPHRERLSPDAAIPDRLAPAFVLKDRGPAAGPAESKRATASGATEETRRKPLPEKHLPAVRRTGRDVETAPRDTEEPSAGAGTLLLIRPLWRIGIAEWLERRPDFAIRGFGRSLLCHFARRMRLRPDDPLFAFLDAERLPEALGAMEAWRIGLDRWLRRRTRRRLADIVNRRGWLDGHGERLAARYPLSAADVRLRRLALDTDPGWVPWLGRVVRYEFRDGPAA